MHFTSTAARPLLPLRGHAHNLPSEPADAYKDTNRPAPASSASPMHFREFPLLNTPHLMLLILREAAGGETSLATCAARLAELLASAREHPPYGEDEILARLGSLRRYLAEARLIALASDGRFSITPRGREALAGHPAGFDFADLMAYPEFASFIHDLSRARAEGRMDPRTSAYDQGHAAFRAGAMLADNPHPSDSADHLAWENGWFEALDESTG